MNKEEFLGKLQMCYFGERNAFDKIVSEYDRLKNRNEFLEKVCVGFDDKYEDYKSRCEKLREYINTHQLFKYIYDEEELFEIITDKEAKKDLENILKGDDNG